MSFTASLPLSTTPRSSSMSHCGHAEFYETAQPNNQATGA
jgi:hypothetical protein